MSTLGGQMRAVADRGHLRAEELREKAREFEEAAKGHFAEPQTVSTPEFMGAWARARRLYCACTGEPLI